MNIRHTSSLPIVAAVALGIWAWAAHADPGCPAAGDAPEDPKERVEISAGDAPSLGPVGAKVTVVIFSDFECPYCKIASERVARLRERYGDRIRIAFKQRPLPMHSQARLAAAAALAADRQGRFWAFHDAIFNRVDRLDRALIDKTAAALGLNLVLFERDLDSKLIAERLAADEAEAAKLDVKGTPTFFINGLRITGAQPLETLTAAIDRDL